MSSSSSALSEAEKIGRESRPELEMLELAPIREKTREMEDFFLVGLSAAGIVVRWLVVEGDRVRVSDGTAEVRVPVGVLSAGLSVGFKDEGKRFLMKGRGLARQIGYITWKGSRNGLQHKERQG